MACSAPGSRGETTLLESSSSLKCCSADSHVTALFTYLTIHTPTPRSSSPVSPQVTSRRPSAPAPSCLLRHPSSPPVDQLQHAHFHSPLWSSQLVIRDCAVKCAAPIIRLRNSYNTYGNNNAFSQRVRIRFRAQSQSDHVDHQKRQL